MDRSGKKSRKDNKRPRVPIKTYRWEDVRRSRKRGGYPWTHLYKPPFEEVLDSESYTMEGMRKAHSSSTMAKYSDMDISEVSDFDTSVASEEIPQGPQIVTEPLEEHSSKNSPGLRVMEECEAGAMGSELEPAESWDNISQYLDKEERDSNVEKKETPASEEEATTTATTDQTSHKRKLSAESSYSRISQTKSAILKKINDAKNKIKVPKLSFPTSKLKAKKPAAKRKPSPPEVKKETKASMSQHQKNSKPVYIHIPLKPPAGQMDEFSHLEFNSKVETKEKQRKPGSFRDLVKQMKQAQEEAQPKLIEQAITEEKNEEVEKNKENLKPLDENEKALATQPVSEDRLEAEKACDQSDIELVEKRNQEEMDTTLPHSEGKEVQESSFEKCENYTQPPTEKEEAEERPMTTEGEEEYMGEDIFDHLFEASSSKQKQMELPTDHRIRSKSAEPEGRRRKLSLESSYSRKSLSKLNFIKKLKDASNKIKSSLSKTGSKKKMSEKEKKPPETSKDEELKPEMKKSKALKLQKNVQPVYIHIPLKPPEGRPDEFSHLANIEKSLEHPEERTSTSPDTPVQKEVQLIILTAPSDDEILDYNSSDVPETPSSENKPFFTCKITELKELAKEVADGVEGKKLDSVEEESNNGKEGGEEAKGTTPTEEFTTVKETESEKLEVMEIGSDEIIEKEGISKDAEDVTKHAEINKVEDENTKKSVKQSKESSKSTKGDEAPNNVVVDEEDGLNETVKENQSANEVENAGEKNEQEDRATLELKSSLKGGGGSPVMKKKVSFKRRSRSSKDGSYEDIQAPNSESTVKKAEPDHNDQVLEGKVEDVAASVIDRVRKERAIEDDKWSKMSDHEYEPVNPPPDNVEPPVSLPPTVYIVDTDYDKGILPLGTISYESTTPAEAKSKEETKVQSEPQVLSSSPKNTTSSDFSEKPKEGPSRFQLALKQQTDNFKNKLHNIKRPHISLPDRPKFNKPDFKKFKIHKPKINLPKIPDTARINLPHFNLHSRKRSLNQRQLSTESQDGDSKKPIFDFSTYPRRFKDKFKSKHSQDPTHFATVPRVKKEELKQEASSRWSESESIRIPLHSEDSMDLNEEVRVHEVSNGQDENNSARNDQNPSHVRYGEDIDIDDEYERENNELNQERDFMNRWNQGRFNEDFNEEYLQNLKNSKYKVTDLDSPEDNLNISYDFNNSESRDRDRDRYSSGSSFGHRRGVIEEINSDEFFWRPKGISQDDINVSMNISSEIREAFRTPANALAQIENIQDQNLNMAGSHQSLPEATAKRKPIKKPKRKKTPHTSQEKIQRQEESVDEDQEVPPPSRPKRRSKRKKKERYSDDIIPYRETISVDIIPTDDRFNEHRESLGILGDDEQDEEPLMYENEKMEGKEQPKIAVTDPYTNFEFADEDESLAEKPAAPPRKQKSLKSLNTSENDSVLGDFGSNGGFAPETIQAVDKIDPEIKAIRTESKVIIPIQTDAPPPKRPSRIRSRTNSQSRGTSQVDEDSLRAESIGAVDFEENEARMPCVEEPCVQDIRDYMGYAIVDKSKPRDPPLPPPRIPSRQKRAPKVAVEQFNTVPRAGSERTPIRPLRNYSTLGQAKNSYNAYENKENIDITQYIEIDDEPSKDLQSGEVIQKMKDRPLPAPPRPPRKSRPFKDITSKENIMQETNDELLKISLSEIEVSTQTEPLPDDFVCEELVQEPTDKIMMPSSSAESKPKDTVKVEKRLITPTYYTHEETITHGSLLVEPLNGTRLLPDSELSKEHIIPITNEAEDETSSIPEEFTELLDPPKKPSSENRRGPVETEVLKAHKLKVTDLDVEKLTVNQLLANKIVVSEIDSSNIQTNEISSKSGTLKVSEINLPPEMINQIIRTIRSSQSDAEETGQKKTSIEARDSDLEEFPDSPMKSISLESFEKEIIAKYSEETPSSLNVGKRETQQDASEQLPPDQVDQDLFQIAEQSLVPKAVEVTVESKVALEFSEHNPEKLLNDVKESEILSEVANDVETLLSEVTEEFKSIPEDDKITLRAEEIECEFDQEILDESFKIVEEVSNIPKESIETPKQSSKLETSKLFLQLEEPADDTGSLVDSMTEYTKEESETTIDKTSPPQPPPRASAHREGSDIPPVRPPRQEKSHSGSVSYQEDSLQEPEVDDEPPPRPPEPMVDYFPSQPPASFYALKAQKYVDDNIPVVPRRRRRTRSRPRTRSSSEDSSPVTRRIHRRSSEGSIVQLSGQLARACGAEINNSLKRLICYITHNVFGNSDGKQDLNVMILIVLVLIAGLILLGYGEEKTVIHLHHWEYFNPPRDF